MIRNGYRAGKTRGILIDIESIVEVGDARPFHVCKGVDFRTSVVQRIQFMVEFIQPLRG